MKTSRKKKSSLSIANSLLHGRDNAITAQALASIYNCTTRVITKAIESDRRHGAAICASVHGDSKGFYIATDPADLANYCKSLNHRLSEITRTRDALTNTLERWQQGETPTE